jgi:hypothetical protein
MADTVGMDDYSLARVPAEARYPWWSIAVQRFGQVSALTEHLQRGGTVLQSGKETQNGQTWWSSGFCR